MIVAAAMVSTNIPKISRNATTMRMITDGLSLMLKIPSMTRRGSPTNARTHANAVAVNSSSINAPVSSAVRAAIRKIEESSR